MKKQFNSTATIKLELNMLKSLIKCSKVIRQNIYIIGSIANTDALDNQLDFNRTQEQMSLFDMSMQETEQLVKSKLCPEILIRSTSPRIRIKPLVSFSYAGLIYFFYLFRFFLSGCHHKQVQHSIHRLICIYDILPKSSDGTALLFACL